MTENQIYYNHQPPAVRALLDMPDGSLADIANRHIKATELATQGYIIDVPIMVYGWGADEVMRERKAYGYTRWPSAFQAPIRTSPGIILPGLKYDPTGLDIETFSPITEADFPPFDKPVPPDIDPVAQSPIGVAAYEGSDTYVPAHGVPQPPAGTILTTSAGRFQFYSVPTPFGFSQYWKKIG